MLAVIGLILIAIAWYFQLRTPQKYNKTFVGLYAVGTLILVINSLGYDGIEIAFLNFVIFLLASWVFFKTSSKSTSRKIRRR